MNWIYNHRKLIAVIAVAVLVLLALPHLWNLDVSDVLSYTPASPILAALVLLGFYCLKSITMVLPIVVLYISAGILFPPAWAVLITYICLICEMSIGYWMGKTMGHDKVKGLISKRPRVAKILSFQEKNSSTTCFLSRR